MAEERARGPYRQIVGLEINQEGIGPLVRETVRVPTNDAALLQHIDAPVLVIGAVGDPMHPEQVARAVASALPNGRLELID